MPILPNPRHESFAQALAKGKSAADAYVDAGYKPSRSAASRLSTNVNVQRRVSELQGKAAEKAEWSAAERLAALKRISAASEANDPRVAVSAISEANKMQGSHAPAKHQHTGRIASIDPTKLKGMTNEELDLLERALVQIGIADGDPAGEGSEEDRGGPQA
ncbi:terminase small subunit [Pseudophaeobacter sp.]|uniref:terminase small subunit n=1 Tax=Pseudophaeobacter sp. TaxID=1971739 RepID=UPI003A98399C